MFNKTVSGILLLLILQVVTYKQKSVYQKITTDPQFSTFSSLVQNSSLAKRAILYWNVTVFAPTDEAFAKFKGGIAAELVYYHICNEVKSVETIFETNKLHTIADGFPPLWISKIDDKIYVNNAAISNVSNYFTRENGSYNNNQVLHALDEVLEPASVYLDNPTAFDLLSNYTKKKWRTSDYLEKIITLKLSKSFIASGSNTYFLPINRDFNAYKKKMIDKYVVEANVVPNQVLFTKPTMKNFYFETKANGDYIYILVSFVESNGKLYVKSNTVLGDSSHLKGELLSEIVEANLPVRNGVVHFVEKPLAVFYMLAKPFPYLPILSKLSTDPKLNITNHLTQTSKFSDHLENSHSLLTFFVPRDKAWKNFLYGIPDDNEKLLMLLGKHLVISNVRHSMESLWYRSIDKLITLNTVGGPIDINVTKDEDGNYSIIYENTSITVHRADYLCTNGIIHIIDRPFITSQGDLRQNVKMEFWKTLKDFVF